MPVEVAFAEHEDAYTGCLPWEAKQDFAIRARNRACAAFNAFFWPIEGIRPIGLDDVSLGQLRQALDIAHVVWRVCPRLVRILTKCAGNEDQIYRAWWQLGCNQLQVFNLAADDGRAADAVHAAYGTRGPSCEKCGLGISEPPFPNHRCRGAALVDEEMRDEPGSVVIEAGCSHCDAQRQLGRVGLQFTNDRRDDFGSCFASNLSMEPRNCEFRKAANVCSIRLCKIHCPADGCHVLRRGPVHGDLGDGYAMRHVMSCETLTAFFAASGTCPLRRQQLGSISAGIRAAIEQQVLPGQVARMNAAHESAEGTELLGGAETAGRHRLTPRFHHCI